MAFFQPDRLPSLMVAPNGARKVKKDHPEIPLTIKEPVEAVSYTHLTLPPNREV